MSLGRKLLLLGLTPIFSALLFSLAFDYGIVKTVGNVATVKKILDQSGVYNSVVSSILKQNGPISTDIGNISSTDPIVKQAAEKALPAGDIQKNSELAIDNLYAWLNGQTTQPTFDINLSSSKDAFANNLATEVQQKLSSLPTCATPYTRSSFDALNATCLPQGLSPSVAANLLKTNLKQGDGALGNINIAANDFKGNSPNKTVFQDQLKNAPSLFQRAKSSPIILAILAILVGALLIFLRPTVASGLRHIGATLLAIGIVMLIFSWAFNYVLANKIIPKINTSNSSMNQNLRRAVTDLGHSIDSNYWAFGGIYSALGIVAISAPLYLSRRTTNQTPKLGPELKDSETNPVEPKSTKQ